MTDRPQRLEFVEVGDWPALAWLACCPKSGSTVTVFHGSRVEVADQWFCEAVWDGPFQEGGFDGTDIVAGSGGRLRDGEVVFVSSGTTVDRLQSLGTGGAVWVSNSFSCLLACTGATLNPSFPGYPRRLASVVAGIHRYQPFLPTSVGSARLTYFHNLAWTGESLAVRQKPGERRDFSTFGKYYAFLQSSMWAVADNIADVQRRYLFEFLSTASSGYDSTTVTVLAKQAGGTRVLCIEHQIKGGSDSGLPVAQLLGMTPVEIVKEAWRAFELPELPFIAADSYGGDVFFRGAGGELSGKVLLTGYHGDKMWDKTIYENDHITRGDVSGLSLTDYRLTTGTIHCPPTFWGGRQIQDLIAISRSGEMAPWDVPGDYSRPICRRIVEEAGVPREMFGMRKRASWVTMVKNKGRGFLSEHSMQNYLEWLKENRGEWLRRGRVPPLRSLRADHLDLSMRESLKQAVDSQQGWAQRALQATGVRRVVGRVHDTPTRLRRYLFPWAVEHHRQMYRRPF